MKEYNSEQEYLKDLATRADLPEGFSCSTVKIEFIPAEKPGARPYPMNLSLILADEATPVFGGLYTKNSFPGAPVLIGRERIGQDFMRGLLINNKISNVCTPGGKETALALLEKLGSELGIDSGELLPFSTGIIGWKLPQKEMMSAIPQLASSLSKDSILPIARAIMTTDSFPKVRSIKIGDGTIVGIAKGAGMIEPKMATMLAFILTDIDISREEIREALATSVEQSFNCISIDGDQSTSDSVIIMSSCRKKSVGYKAFNEALHQICHDLAEDIVRNGEGTGHVIRVTVRGDISYKLARSIGKAIINSPLFKTAVFGNDPNTGRIIGAIGNFLGTHNINIDKSSLVIKIGGVEIFKENQFALDMDKEKRLSDYLKERKMDPAIKGYPQHGDSVELEITIGEGTNECTVIGSDLSYEYVKENADYRS